MDLRDFPVPINWAELQSGNLVHADLGGVSVIGLVVGHGNPNLLLVLSILDGPNHHGVKAHQIVGPGVRAAQIGRGQKLLVRPAETQGVPSEGEPKNGALIVSSGPPCVRIRQADDTYNVSLADGKLIDLPAPRAYYEAWEIVAVDGERERLITAIQASN